MLLMAVYATPGKAEADLYTKFMFTKTPFNTLGHCKLKTRMARVDDIPCWRHPLCSGNICIWMWLLTSTKYHSLFSQDYLK